MARQSEAFIIDGDDLIKVQAKAASKAPAGSQTVPLEGQRPAAASTYPRGSSRPAGAASLSLWFWGAGQWLNGDRDLIARPLFSPFIHFFCSHAGILPC